MEVSRKYQYGRTMELRDCFPYAYSREANPIRQLAMVKEELYICDSFSKDEVLTVDSYEDVARCINQGEADAGMGIIEEIGVGVSDELHHLLLKNQFYITDCVVREEKGVRRKIVTFRDHLLVLPEHNRVKIMFECPNHSGSISSILSMISDYGVNLTEIHSRPFEKEEGWNYMFFVEMNANIDTKEIRALIYQLSQETHRLQILGSYFCEGDF
jgi:chorismate mutase/prephenate dehydratase